MSAGNLIFLFLIVGGALAMFSMHRGGHTHSGSGGGGGGGCGGGHGGHNHGGRDEAEQAHDSGGEQGTKPLLGPPGTGSDAQTAAAGGHRHGG